jgi:hypothetical protein
MRLILLGFENNPSTNKRRYQKKKSPFSVQEPFRRGAVAEKINDKRRWGELTQKADSMIYDRGGLRDRLRK